MNEEMKFDYNLPNKGNVYTLGLIRQTVYTVSMTALIHLKLSKVAIFGKIAHENIYLQL